jgi:hypothetical protein
VVYIFPSGAERDYGHIANCDIEWDPEYGIQKMFDVRFTTPHPCVSALLRYPHLVCLSISLQTMGFMFLPCDYFLFDICHF